jgi:hypothetical protein
VKSASSQAKESTSVFTRVKRASHGTKLKLVPIISNSKISNEHMPMH